MSTRVGTISIALPGGENLKVTRSCSIVPTKPLPLIIVVMRLHCRYGAPSKFSGGSLRQKVAGESFFYGGKIVSTNTTPPSRKEKVTTKSLAGSSSVGKDYLNAFKEKQNENKTTGVLHFTVRTKMDNFALNKKNEIDQHSWKLERASQNK